MTVHSGISLYRPSGLEQVQPFGPAVPFFGQVQGEVAAAVAGGACGDVGQVAAHGALFTPHHLGLHKRAGGTFVVPYATAD